ncbi:hypothetical protein PSHT_00712, partial [Puccinia striiformis]
LLETKMHSLNSILLVFILAAVGTMQHEAKGPVLHPRKVDALIGQDRTCGKGMTRYCNTRRVKMIQTARKQILQEVVPPRGDGTIPTKADCAKLMQQEVKDPEAVENADWQLSGCCDATKFDKWDQKPNNNVLVTDSSWALGCGIATTS